MNRSLSLQAAFTARDGRFDHANGYGQAMWDGIFDAAYTQPGDYLAQERGTWFIAAQQLLAPILCVKTNRCISIARQAVPSDTGLNSYGGSNILPNTLVLENWPASVMGSTGRVIPMPVCPATCRSRIGRYCCRRSRRLSYALEIWLAMTSVEMLW